MKKNAEKQPDYRNYYTQMLFFDVVFVAAIKKRGNELL